MKKLLRIFAAAALLAVTLWCGLTVETEDWVVASSRLPEEFDGLRVTLLTDVHGCRRTEALVEAVRNSGPDVIAVCGDLVDEFSDLSMLEPLLTGLADLAPVYYVTGNHEWVREDTEQLLARIDQCGVTVLRNEHLLLTRDGASVTLVGIEDKNGYADMATPEEVMERTVGFTLVLHHRNDEPQLWADLDADVVLAGHGHGGIIQLPMIGGLFDVDRSLFPKYEEGLYETGNSIMAVSRGAGGVRLWNRPHIPTVVLKHK